MTASASSWNACSPAVFRRALPMTTSDVWSIARLDARRSNDAPATTAGAVPIGSSRLRMTATASLSIATAPRASCRWPLMPMAGRSIVSPTRWAICITIPTRSYASTSKEVVSRSRVNGHLSMTRMDNS